MSSVDIYSILSSKPHNSHYLKRYWKFIQSFQHQVKIKKNTEQHHICPKSNDLFPEYKSLSINTWNGIHLTHRQHFIAHWLLAKAYKGKQIFAFWAMCNQNCDKNNKTHRKVNITANAYNIAKTMAVDAISYSNKGRPYIRPENYIPVIPCFDEHGTRINVTVNEYKSNSTLKSINTGYVSIRDENNNIKRITKDEFYSQTIYKGMQSNSTCVFDTEKNIKVRVSPDEYRKNKKYVSVTKGMNTLVNIYTGERITILCENIVNYDDSWVNIYCSGFYHVPTGVYTSSNHQDLYKYGTPTSIISWCKNSDKIITKLMVKRSKYLSDNMIGSALRDIGFWFEPFPQAHTSPQEPVNAPLE